MFRPIGRNGCPSRSKVVPERVTVPAGGPAGCGVTGLDGSDGGPVPTEFVAVTVNVYVTPFVRPLTVAVVASPAAVAVCPPGEEVTVYSVIGLPPSSGAYQLTVALESPAVAVTPAGACG